MKLHLKLNGKPVCGTKAAKNPLRFVNDKSEVTCKNCLRAIAR